MKYLPIIDLQWIKFIRIFSEAAGGPAVPRLLLIKAAEVVHGRVFIIKLIKFVSSDGGAHSAPRPEHPVPKQTTRRCYKSLLPQHKVWFL